MSARRPTAFTMTAEQLLASKPRLPISRSNSLESAHRRFVASCPECREHALSQKIISLEEELRKAELETERFRLENAKLQQRSQTGNSHKNTIQRTLSDPREFREENSSLKLEVQRNEGLRADLGQQLLSVRQENDKFRQQLHTIGQEKKSIVQENDRISKENASMRKKLDSLVPEAAILRNEKARLEHEKALLKKEFEEERVSLQKKIDELKWDEEQHKPLLQKLGALQQHVEKLQRSLDRETEKLKETQQREQFLQNELNKFKDSSYPCPKTKCMETRTERAQLARKFETKCERPECVTAKANLEEAKNRIRQ